MTAYYNEIDPYAAQWLRNLIAAGHIAPGVVDERSIADVRPSDLFGFTQCHFFAGIGVWSYALRRSGWPDDRPVWTGSCPCQPFSDAGAGGGFDDERHLWPHWHHLIRVCRPPHVFGEQVASKDGLGWLDLVQADMEGESYALWPLDMCAAGVGAPHIRQRLWFTGEDQLADPARHHQWTGLRDRGQAGLGRHIAADSSGNDILADRSGGGQRVIGSALVEGKIRYADGGSDAFGGLDDGYDARSQGHAWDGHGRGGWTVAARSVATPSIPSGLADPNVKYDDRAGHGAGYDGKQFTRSRSISGVTPISSGRPGPTNGVWGDADWLFCRDGKWRPVEPGTFPLAHGATSRVGRLRAYGNAIVAQAAEEVISTFLEYEHDLVADRSAGLIGHNSFSFDEVLG